MYGSQARLIDLSVELRMSILLGEPFFQDSSDSFLDVFVDLSLCSVADELHVQLQMSSNRELYKLPNQQIQKSIIYEIPRGQQSSYGRLIEPSTYNKLRYKVREDIELPKDRNDEFLCLNCHRYIRSGEVDKHSLEHINTDPR